MRKLKLFMAACALMGASAVSAQSWTAGVEAAAGDYYLYNVGSGTFLNRGSSYTTHATVDGAGCVITISGTTDAFLLHFPGIADASYLSNGGWIDAANSRDDYTTWSFVTATADGYTNVYKLKANNGEKYLNWAGGKGQYGNEAIVGDESDTNGCWILIPKETRESTEGASESNPIDVTYLMKNPDMEADANKEGSTTNDWTGDQNFVKQYNNPDGMSANFLERWWGQWNQGTGANDKLNDFDTHQTLKNLPAGKYSLSVTAAAVQQNTDLAGEDPTGIYLYAGENTTDIKGLNTYSVNFDATGEDITVGVKTVSTNVNWVRFDQVRLYYMGVDLSLLKEAYDNAVAAAEAFDMTQKMGNTEKEALTLAKENYTSGVSETESALQEATDALNDAVKDATASVEAYAKLKAVIDKIDEAIKTTNVYDKAFFDAAKESYENGYYSTEEANALSGSDRYKTLYTYVLAGNWFIGEKAATEANSGLYQNHWSREGDSDGSNMKTPFMEYWVGDGDALAANTLSTTIEGLTANETYNISMLVRVRQQNGQTKADDDITLTLNGGEAISLVDGTQIQDVFFYQTVQATATADEDGKIAIAISIKDGNHISWLAFKNLNYSNDTGALATEFAKLQGEAETLLSENDIVTGDEKEALETAKGASPSSIEEYTAANSALQTAIDEFKAAIPSYQAFAAEKEIAEDLGVSDLPSPTTAADAAAAVNDLKVAEHNYVVETYTTDITATFASSWTVSNFDYEAKGQHWSGEANKYYDKWNGGAMTSTVSKTVTLPEGHYVFYAAGRGQADKSTAKLTVKIGEETKEISYLMKGDTGYGIDKEGNANFTAADDTYANDNNGRGWEWRHIVFDLDSETEVTLSAVSTENGSWASVSDLTLATYDNAAIIQLMVSEEVEKAKALIAANVGDGVFQIPSSAAEALQSAISAAENVTSDSEVESAIKDLQDAEEELQKAVLNAPDASQKYNIVIATPDHAKEGNAVIFALGNTGANNPTGYTLNAGAKPNANLAQAFTFTQVEGNIYNISFESAEGTTYLTYGAKNGSAAGWKDSQIQATTVADNKGEFRIAASATEGAFNIYNTITNSTIACQSGGNIYTESGNADFSLTEAEDCSITVNTEAGFGTIIVPFDVTSIPEGVTVYSCSGVEDNKLTLTAVDAIEANKPYIIEGAWSETLTGDALGTALINTVGALTGVYADQAAVADTYVMQNNSTTGIGFYKVASGSEPEITANHAYLTVSSAGAREAYLLGEATAIKAIEALTTGKAEIYNAAGARLQRLQKGVNIIKSGDKTVKVMVK